jgi:hypothetical protein
MIRVGTISVHHETIETRLEDWKEIERQIARAERRMRRAREASRLEALEYLRSRK